jgi:hypothetical protein
MAWTNGAPVRAWRNDGQPLEVRSDLVVVPATTNQYDFVVLTTGAWAVYAQGGAVIGGIFLGRDSGSLTGTVSTGVTIGTPGFDASGPGVYDGEGGTVSAVTGAVALLTKDCYVEIDIVEGVDSSAMIPGFTAVELMGTKRVSASQGGWYIQANGGAGVDSCCEIVEVLRHSATGLRGRAIVKFNQSSLTLDPG